MSNLNFATGEQLPCYVNNARMEVTEDNVFLDFGVADPFVATKANVSTSHTRARLVMNRSTFMAFAAHVSEIRAKLERDPSTSLPISILSRCPPTIDPGG